MGAKRKKEIYDICVEYGESTVLESPDFYDIHFLSRTRLNISVPLPARPQLPTYSDSLSVDILIIEDDPYYFLQVGNYVPKSERTFFQQGKDSDVGAAFLASLAPSYLKFDYQGRVIRLDSFSKVRIILTHEV
jgi:aromatic amino acid aminotransferase I